MQKTLSKRWEWGKVPYSGVLGRIAFCRKDLYSKEKGKLELEEKFRPFGVGV